MATRAPAIAADLMIVAGLGGIGWGLWGVDPRLAGVVVGLLVLGLGLVGARNEARRGEG